MDNSFSMTPQEGHYSQQPQRQQQWHPHLLPQPHPQNAFPSPPPTEHGNYPFYPSSVHQQQQQQPDRVPTVVPGSANEHLGRGSSLSLNLSSLTVASSNPSPINPTGPGLSPATPISPSGNPFGSLGHHHIQSPYQYESVQNSNQPTASSAHYDEHGGVLSPPSASSAPSPFDGRRTAGPSRSSSATSSSSHLPRKRSFTSNASSVSLAGTLVEETLYDESRESAMDLASQAGGYDDMEMRNAYGVGAGGSGGSPIDGSSGSGDDAMGSTGMNGMPIGMGGSMNVGGSMNILGKPMATNNFVTKLYQ